MENTLEKQSQINLDKDAFERKSVSFESMGLDPRILRALIKGGVTNPTAVQSKCIPLALEGRDIVARARTGSGKTLAYLLPALQKILANEDVKGGFSCFILVPTKELCQQVHDEAARLANLCGGISVCQLSAGMNLPAMRAALQGAPDIVVATPGRLGVCLKEGILSPEMMKEHLQTLIMDEADLLLSYGYENDVRSIAVNVPRRCQSMLMSATTSPDVDKLKKLILHSPVTLTLTEADGSDEGRGGIPNTVKQYAIRCSENDKLLHTLALLKLNLVQAKALLFVPTIDFGFRLRLFLEQFGLRSAVLNAELPLNSRLHILTEFNRGLFDYLIATDQSDASLGKNQKREKQKKENGKNSAEAENGEDKEKTKEGGGREAEEEGEEEKGLTKGVEVSEKGNRVEKKLSGTGEFGVVRGIDFKGVRTVINLSLPESATSYVHRVGRTGRAGNAGTAVTLVSPAEASRLASFEAELAGHPSPSPMIGPFPLLNQQAVEALRYRADDVARGVTRVKVREARARELRLEMLNSERLKAHFEDNPTDRELLKHDKVLSKTAPAPHLKVIPGYLRDAATEAASRTVQLAGRSNPHASAAFIRQRMARKKVTASMDPLKSFAFKSPSRKDGEAPDVAAALAGTLWARKKQKDKMKRGGSSDDSSRREGEKRKSNAAQGKFQSSRKHKRRKR